MSSERILAAPRSPDAAAEPADRSLTELGRPSDPALAHEIETDQITPELLDSTGMRSLFEVWRHAALRRGRSMPSRADFRLEPSTSASSSMARW